MDTPDRTSRGRRDTLVDLTKPWSNTRSNNHKAKGHILDFQLLGLYAIISNYDKLVEWLNSELVGPTYRPVEVEEGICPQNTVEFSNTDGNAGETGDRGEDDSTEDDSGTTQGSVQEMSC